MTTTLHPIHVSRYDDGDCPQCEFCGYPFSTGDRAFQVGEDGPIVCSRGCASNLADLAEYLDSPGLDYLPGRDPAETDTDMPNNVCVLKRIRPDGDGSKIVYCVVTRYNFTPEPLGGQHRDATLYECPTLGVAVIEAVAVGHDHNLTVCCSFNLSNRAECANLAPWPDPAESEVR